MSARQTLAKPRTVSLLPSCASSWSVPRETSPHKMAVDRDDDRGDDDVAHVWRWHLSDVEFIRGERSAPYDAHHQPDSVAARGRCSQHGVGSCSETPVGPPSDKHNRSRRHVRMFADSD